MIILGPVETLQLIDGSEKHAAVRALKTITDKVGIAAPALAYAADAIGSAQDGQRQRLENALEGLIDRGREETKPGLQAELPVVPILPFGRHEARAFPRIVAALRPGAHRHGALLIQSITIAHLRDASLMLERTPASEEIETLLTEAGIHLTLVFVD